MTKWWGADKLIVAGRGGVAKVKKRICTVIDEMDAQSDGITRFLGGGVVAATRKAKAPIEQIRTIGVDLAKQSFQLHDTSRDWSGV